MRPFTDPVGVAVGVEKALEGWLNDIAEGMVNNPVPEGGGADQPPFGFVNGEMLVSARFISVGCEIALQLEQPVSQTKFKEGGGLFAPFPASRFVICFPQILPTDHARK